MAQGTQPMRNYWIALLPVSCVIFVILIAPRLLLDVPSQEQGNNLELNCKYTDSQRCSFEHRQQTHKRLLLKKLAVTIALAKFSYPHYATHQFNQLSVTGYEGLCY